MRGTGKVLPDVEVDACPTADDLTRALGRGLDLPQDFRTTD